MPASADLTTRAKVESYLGLEAGTDSTLIDSLIDAASEAIEHVCAREFAEQAHTEYHDGGAKRIVLRHRPISTSPAPRVWNDTARKFETDDELDLFADGEGNFDIDYDAGIVRHEGGEFLSGWHTVKVTYTAGYATIPDDLAQAATMLVAHWYHRGKQGADGLTSESIAGYAASYDAADMPEAVRAILSRYAAPSNVWRA